MSQTPPFHYRAANGRMFTFYPEGWSDHDIAAVTSYLNSLPAKNPSTSQTTTETCGTCRFGVARNVFDQERECRRHAAVLQLQIRYPNDYNDSASRASWPKVREYDWCGDYEAKPVEIGEPEP